MITTASTVTCPVCGSATREKRQQYLCGSCATVHEPSRRDYSYTDQYPKSRSHDDEIVRSLKQKSLQAWLAKTGIEAQDKKILEIGFGAGATLQYLATKSSEVYGLEVVESNREAARKNGLRSDHVIETLSELRGKGLQFDLILYCDSFEHLLDPRKHLAELSELTHPGSQALLVLPRADCLSRRWMGPLWPHDLPDHWVFYSRKGLAKLWEEFGWKEAQTFYPTKFVSIKMVSRHAAMKLPIPADLLPERLGQMTVPVNFGELGVVYERTR